MHRDGITLTFEESRRLAAAHKMPLGVSGFAARLIRAAEVNRRLLDEYAELRQTGKIKTTVRTEYEIERVTS